MSGFLAGLRNLFHGSAERRAVEDESDMLARYVDKAGELDARLVAAYGGASGGDAIRLGKAVEMG